MSDNPYCSPASRRASGSNSRGVAIVIGVLMVVGTLSALAGVYATLVRYHAGGLVMYSSQPDLRELSKAEWKAIGTGLRACVLTIAVPLLLSTTAFFIATCLSWLRGHRPEAVATENDG